MNHEKLMSFLMRLLRDERGEVKTPGGDDPADPKPGDDPADPKPGDDPDKKVFQFKDPVSGKSIDLPENLRPLIGHIISKSKNDAKAELDKKYKPLEKQLNEIRSKNADLDTKLREIEEENMSAEDKFKVQQEREKKQSQEKFDAEKTRADEGWSNFHKHKIENDVMKAVGKHELCNAAQTATLISSLGNAKIVKNEETGQHETRLTLKLPDESGKLVEQDLPPNEAVDKFLALDENAHHLRNNLRSGGGTSNTGGRRGADGAINFTREDMKDPAKKKEYHKKLKAGEAVQIVES